jgi:hypothetical protein
MPKEGNRPIGENSPNLVTLVESQVNNILMLQLDLQLIFEQKLPPHILEQPFRSFLVAPSFLQEPILPTIAASTNTYVHTYNTGVIGSTQDRLFFKVPKNIFHEVLSGLKSHQGVMFWGK